MGSALIQDKHADRHKVDAVYTFVDQTDPKWGEKYATITGKIPDPRRYANHGELEFSIELLIRHCDFLNNIYIVTPTPNKVSKKITNKTNVFLVEDDEILGPESSNPSFKSCTIESYLHNIKGLTEYFFYLCDDYFVGREIKYEQFFEDGKGIAYLRKSPMVADPFHPNYYSYPVGIDIMNANRCIQRKYNRFLSYAHLHQIALVKKECFGLMWDYFKKELRKSIAYPTRSPPYQTVFPIVLVQMIGCLENKMIMRTIIPFMTMFIHVGQNIPSMIRKCANLKPHLFCINNLFTISDIQEFERLKRRYLGSAFKRKKKEKIKEKEEEKQPFAKRNLLKLKTISKSNPLQKFTYSLEDNQSFATEFQSEMSVMNLNHIEKGKKKIDIRLEKEQWTNLKVGQTITYWSRYKKIKVTVKSIKKYNNIQELVNNINVIHVSPTIFSNKRCVAKYEAVLGKAPYLDENYRITKVMAVHFEKC